ncbi:MAG: YihY family inner membrane protein, partial [Aeromonas sp.]
MQQHIRGRLAHALYFIHHDGRHFAQFVWGRFQQDRLTVTAGYLAYVTLLSLVPMIAVVFGMMSAFPVFQSLKQEMEQFVYHNFVPTAGDVLKEYIDGFVANATNTTAVGVGALVVVALMLISAIDKNLNYIWRSTQSRPLAQAFAMYWMILTLGPVLIGASIAISSYIFSLRLFGAESL